jgi:D-3-phosphoglycerate dehydrogenase
MARIAYVDCSPMMAATLARLHAHEGMRVFEGDPDPAQLRATIAQAGVVLNGHTAMDAALLEAHPRLRSIVFLGTGASSYVDVEAAARLGIRVRTIRGYGDRSVAEHAFALLLAAARGIARMDRGLRAGAWTQAEGIELGGRTLGLLGLGGVGSEMARIASGFGMRVVGWSRSGMPAGLPVEAMALDDVLADADAVSLHLALCPETRGLLDAARIARMKTGAILVNTARGALVDEAAMLAALASGQLGHAALDVFSVEPLPATHPLLARDDVTLAAHSGWKSADAARRLMEAALRLATADAAALDAGHPLAP